MKTKLIGVMVLFANFFAITCSLAASPVVEIKNGSKPGSLEIVAHEPVLLDYKLNVERMAADGTFVPLQNLDLDTMRLVTSCNQKIGKTVRLTSTVCVLCRGAACHARLSVITTATKIRRCRDAFVLS